MIRGIGLTAFAATILLAGCHSDIVTTNYLKELDQKCVYIAPVQSEDSHVGQVVRDVLEKEFIRRKIPLCDPNSATVILTGATFMTTRGKSSSNWVTSAATSAQACESVSITAKDRENHILLSASYDNSGRKTVSQFAKNFGSALAAKFR
jgi:hypothetical protein